MQYLWAIPNIAQPTAGSLSEQLAMDANLPSTSNQQRFTNKESG